MKYKTQNLIEGVKGESLAVKYLESAGYKVLMRNFKCVMGEIDIIVEDKDADRIVFVEVKTRSSLAKGYGREAITSDKLSHMRASATMYLKARKMLDKKVRFDILEVVDTHINHLKAVL